MTTEALLLMLAQINNTLANQPVLSGQAILDLLLTVDGAGSGLDADLFDGEDRRVTYVTGLDGTETLDTYLLNGITFGQHATTGSWPGNYGVYVVVRGHNRRGLALWYKNDQEKLWYRISNNDYTWRTWQQVITADDGGQTTLPGDLSVGGTIVQPNWIAPTLLNGWVNYGGVTEPAGYYLDSNGVVHIRGRVKDGTSNIVCSLPAGYRPAYATYQPIISFDGTAHIAVVGNVNTAGDVWIDAVGNDWASLAGLSFRVT